MEILTPGLVFAANGTAFARAIAAAVPADVEVVVTENPAGSRPMTPFAELSGARPTAAVDAAHANVGPDTIAKILFTSGSTGQPKGVINPQRMLCANQAMILGGLEFVADEPPVLLDWLPWNHTFGGNHDFGPRAVQWRLVLHRRRQAVPGAIEITVRNLRDIAPTIYFNVPKGFEMLLPHLAVRSRGARKIFQPAQGDVLRRRRPAAARARRAAGSGGQNRGRARHLSQQPRFDGDRRRPRWPAAGKASASAISACRCRASRSNSSPRRASSRRGSRAPTSRPAIGARRPSPRPPSTRRGSTRSATRSNSRTPPIRPRACFSTGASPRTSSSPPAPGSASDRCAWR